MPIIASDSNDVARLLRTDSSGRLFTLGTPVAAATNAAVSVAITSTAVIAANAARTFATFVNDSANVIYICLGTPAVANAGIRLNANGGSFEINRDNLYTGAVTAIAVGGASNLVVTEG